MLRHRIVLASGRLRHHESPLLSDNHLEPFVEGQPLGGVRKYCHLVATLVTADFHGISQAGFCIYLTGIGHCSDAPIDDLIDGAVVHQIRQAAFVVLPYLQDLTTDALSVNWLQAEFTVITWPHLSDIIITSYPQDTRMVEVERRQIGIVWRVENMPLGIIVVEQSLEISHIDCPVFMGQNVKVTVMGAIFRSRVVSDKRHALCHDGSAAQQQTERYKQTCHHNNLRYGMLLPT